MFDVVKVWFLLTCTTACLAQGDPQATIPQGTLRGTYRKTVKGKTFRSFTGIPYAKPPVGELRFQPPSLADPWKGILDASKPHAMCPQSDVILGIFNPSGSEDCLFLNVYTPKVTKEPLPVMVFIHGGGWTAGSANADLNGPDILLDKDVVLVTVNYRLGALGFLSTGDEVFPGNNGLKDQSLALKWVKNNIGHFGGDPQRLTIFGQSAGGASVHYHLLSPLSKDLLFAAIAHSGTSLATWAFAPRSQAVANARRLGEYLNCPTNSSREMMDCLKKVDAYDIIRQDSKFVEWNLDPCIPFKPVAEPNNEGAFITDVPVEIIKSGNFAQVPFIASVTTQDGALESAIIFNKTKLVQEFDEDFDKFAPFVFQYDEHVPHQKQLTKLVRKFYVGDRNIDDSTKAEITDMMSDVWFMAAQNYMSVLQAKSSSAPVYQFLFGYRGSVSYSPFYGDPTHNYGVAHADDLIYLLSSELFPDYKPSDSDKQMNEIMTTLWTNFAKTGNPTPEVNEAIRSKWEPIQGDHLRVYFMESANNMSMIEDPYQKRTEFWKSHPIFTGTTETKR